MESSTLKESGEEKARGVLHPKCKREKRLPSLHFFFFSMIFFSLWFFFFFFFCLTRGKHPPFFMFFFFFLCLKRGKFPPFSTFFSSLWFFFSLCVFFLLFEKKKMLGESA